MHRSVSASAFATLLLLTAACAGADAPADENTDVAAESAAESAPEVTAPEAPARAGLMNPNDATEADLANVPGLTPELVSAIVAGRPWTDMLGVDAALAGTLDESAREEVYRHLWIRIDLNAASEEEMLLIPGVGSRMAYEFDEYRPYDAMARFRAEIGKYVDEDELNRLEQYVEIR